MAEQEQTVSQEQQTSTQQTPEPTLDDVYKQFNVEAAASEFQQQPNVQNYQANPQQQQQPQQQSVPQLGGDIPDPVLQQDSFRTWLAQQNQGVQRALADLKMTQQQLAVMEMRRREETDIQSAVQKVQEKLGDVEPDFVEIAMGLKARKDPKFLAVYQKRNQNPAAWGAALAAFASELKGKTSFKQDSQLTENVRAARQSTQTSLTSTQPDSSNPIESRLGAARTQREFDAEWQRIMSSGS